MNPTPHNTTNTSLHFFYRLRKLDTMHNQYTQLIHPYTFSSNSTILRLHTLISFSHYQKTHTITYQYTPFFMNNHSPSVPSLDSGDPRSWIAAILFETGSLCIITEVKNPNYTAPTNDTLGIIHVKVCALMSAILQSLP